MTPKSVHCLQKLPSSIAVPRPLSSRRPSKGTASEKAAKAATSHQQKKLNEKELREFRTRFGIPISDEEVVNTPFIGRPATVRRSGICENGAKHWAENCPDAPSAQHPPGNSRPCKSFRIPEGNRSHRGFHHDGLCADARDPPAETRASATISFRSSPMSPAPSAWTPSSGSRSTLRSQLYEPVDRESLLFYREIANGQILEKESQRREQCPPYCRRNRIRESRRQHDSVLHLLFDVRFSAYRRSGMGCG